MHSGSEDSAGKLDLKNKLLLIMRYTKYTTTKKKLLSNKSKSIEERTKSE